MYENVSQEFSNIIADSGRTFKAKLVNGTDEITDVRSFTLHQAENGSDNIGIGGGIAGYIDCTIGNTNLLLENVEYDLYTGLKISGDNYEYVPVGKFTPKKPTIKSEVTTFTAYDRMMSSSFLAGYFSNIESYPADAKDILMEIESQTGIGIDTSNLPSGLLIDRRTVITDSGVDEEGNELQNTTYEKPFTGYTIRETICYIAQMFGKFAYIDRQGIVKFGWFEDCRLQYIESQYKDDIGQSESEFVLGTIKCSTGANELISGAGATGISIENPVMTQEILDNVYQLVGGFRCKGISVTLLGDIRLDVGDIIKIRRNGEYIEIPVMKLETTFDGGISQKVYAFGKVDSIEEQKGPTAERLDRMYNELLLVKEVVANKVSTESLEARVANLGFASIKELTTEVAKMGLMTAEEADIAYAKIDFSNIETTTIGKMFADIGLVSDMTIVDGHITGTLSGVKITGDVIETNTIKADCLLLTGEDGVIYRINATAGGLSKEELADEKYQKYLSGTDIVAGSITSTQLAAGSITADKILSKAVTADKLNVNTLSAISADLGTVTAGVIQSSNYEPDVAGMKLNLSDGSWDSRYTKIAADGKLTCSDISITGGKINIESETDTDYVLCAHYSNETNNKSIQISPTNIYGYNNGEYIDISPEVIQGYVKNSSGYITYNYILTDSDCICEGSGYSFSDLYSKVNSILLTVYPVGSIYLSVRNVNPGTLFGGTWVAWGSGRVMVGVGTFSAGEAQSAGITPTQFSNPESTGGLYKVGLTASQNGPHSHGAGTLATAGSGNHKHTAENGAAYIAVKSGSYNNSTKITTGSGSKYGAIGDTAGGISRIGMSNSGNHTHTITGRTGADGTGEGHENMPPYITCYMWKRTA